MSNFVGVIDLLRSRDGKIARRRFQESSKAANDGRLDPVHRPTLAVPVRALRQMEDWLE